MRINFKAAISLVIFFLEILNKMRYCTDLVCLSRLSEPKIDDRGLS